MGYGYYIIDGKECGYAVLDVCNHPDCGNEIDRGLAYACGGEPGDDYDYCDGYFCGFHLYFTARGQRCEECAKGIEEEE